MNNLNVSGKFRVVCFDRDGSEKWSHDLPNGIVDVGLHYLLEASFRAGAAISTWYVGLIDNAAFSALANADTMASHAGWTESVAYTQATRPAWTAGVAATRTMTNAVSVDFSMNATAVIRGLFINSNNTKSGTTGTLWSTAAFGTNAPVADGDTLKITYTVSG